VYINPDSAATRTAAVAPILTVFAFMVQLVRRGVSRT
jgi:hypothetical protein